jgi:hypothetical protein
MLCFLAVLFDNQHENLLMLIIAHDYISDKYVSLHEGVDDTVPLHAVSPD